jgi:predicted AlkP superfamily pyrophosphatase or phosphodiesterase
MKKFLILTAFIAATLTSAKAESPKLVVSIIVDQLRYDYLERFQSHFTDKGFGLFYKKGAVVSFGRYNYFPTSTAPGHATVLSGAPPSQHGIIGNDWFDKRTRQSVYCAEDKSVEGVGVTGSSGQRSPKNFIGANLADQMRLHFGSRVVGISMKDRGAILPAGKKPVGAYWFNSKDGHFVTSTYYHEKMPAWVDAFNKKDRAGSFLGTTWDRLLPASEYAFADDALGERSLAGEKKPVFPHRIGKKDDKSRSAVMPTPFANQILMEFAIAAIEGTGLGKGPQPDLLCVSFSPNDYVGHSFGPHSHEVQDTTIRLDRQLNEFFTYLDKKIGLENVLIHLTADHGVAPTPEFAQSQGIAGGRYKAADHLLDLMGKLSDRFGAAKYFLYPRFSSGQLIYDHDVLRKQKVSVTEINRFIREWAFDTGIYQAAYSRDQLLDGRAPGMIGRAVFNGFNGERGADMILIAKPFVIPTYGKGGTTHGSPFNYDTHVPILFYGHGVKPGRYDDEFYITDIAPTLAAILRVEVPPGSIGRPLTKLLR